MVLGGFATQKQALEVRVDTGVVCNMQQAEHTASPTLCRAKKMIPSSGQGEYLA